VLSDPEKRKLYDEFGTMGLQSGFDAEKARQYRDWQRGGGWSPGESADGYADFEDLFSDLGGLFGGRGARARRGPVRGPDLEAELELDLLDSIRGTTQTIQVGGERLNVKIPAGVDEGSRIRLAGKGAAGRGGPRGDLYVVVHLRPHPFLERKGLDLSLDLPVTVGEAALGARIPVPTPEGNVTLSLPPGTQSGKRLRLRSKGVKRGSTRGDLYVRVLVHVPKDGGDEARHAVEELERFYPESPRADLKL